MSWPVSAAGSAAEPGRLPLVYSLSLAPPFPQSASTSRPIPPRPTPPHPAPPRRAGSPLKVHRCLCGPAGPNLLC